MEVCLQSFADRLNGRATLVLLIEDDEACKRQLQFHGIECEPIREDMFDGKKIVVCYDPDGLMIEFREGE